MNKQTGVGAKAKGTARAFDGKFSRLRGYKSSVRV